MSAGAKVAIALGYVMVAAVAFFAGRESLKAELRQGLQEAFAPLAGLADQYNSPSSSSSEPAAPAPVLVPAWSVDEDKSAMDDSRTVTMSIRSTGSIRAWPNEKFTPLLVIRCRENKTNLYIVNGTSPHVEYGVDGATVRLRLDDAAAFSREWSKSTDGEALFAPNAIGLAKQLAATKTMLYEFTPFNSNPQQATFELEGIAEHLPKVASACGWSL